MSSAVTGMDASQQWMSVVGNNIANMNTMGYKASEVNFQALLSQTLSKGNGGNIGGLGGSNPQQVGTGVSIGSITPNFSSGALTNTGNPNDLAITGNGFFVVYPSNSTLTSSPTPPAGSTPTSPGTPTYYTRAGNFSVDSNGYLVDPNGNYLMGVETKNSSGTAVSPAVWGPINVNDSSGNPSTYTVGADGTVTVQGGNTYQLYLANFPNPAGLTSAGSNLYTAPAGGNAGAVSYLTPGSGTFGTISQGYLESSNVDLTQEMSNMIQAQTMYDGNSKMIQTVSGMYQFMLQQV